MRPEAQRGRRLFLLCENAFLRHERWNESKIALKSESKLDAYGHRVIPPPGMRSAIATYGLRIEGAMIGPFACSEWRTCVPGGSAGKKGLARIAFDFLVTCLWPRRRNEVRNSPSLGVSGVSQLITARRAASWLAPNSPCRQAARLCRRPARESRLRHHARRGNLLSGRSARSLRL
jgi:hypothetical protein